MPTNFATEDDSTGVVRLKRKGDEKKSRLTTLRHTLGIEPGSYGLRAVYPSRLNYCGAPSGRRGLEPSNRRKGGPGMP